MLFAAQFARAKNFICYCYSAHSLFLRVGTPRTICRDFGLLSAAQFAGKLPQKFSLGIVIRRTFLKKISFSGVVIRHTICRKFLAIGIVIGGTVWIFTAIVIYGTFLCRVVIYGTVCAGRIFRFYIVIQRTFLLQNALYRSVPVVIYSTFPVWHRFAMGCYSVHISRFSLFFFFRRPGWSKRHSLWFFLIFAGIVIGSTIQNFYFSGRVVICGTVCRERFFAAPLVVTLRTV